LLSVGRRSALERCAHLLLVLAQRFEELAPPTRTPDKIRIPVTQQHVADTLGLSLVHTNRTLGRLMRERVVRWKEQEFEILNRKRLAELAGDEGGEPAVRPLL
jgi:CRP-like cAMP-binding protein